MIALSFRLAMGPESVLFIFELIMTTALLFMSVYFIICLSDLECDYLNATSCCRKLNMCTLPEAVVSCIVVVLLFGFGHWYLMIFGGLLAFYQIYRILKVPKGNTGIYDPTEIHNKQVLKGLQKECFSKLGFHLVFFFIYLYNMVYSLVEGT
ncbi:protein cornichon homolog 4-like [Oscarella lobularis]|uniref:protein cornichon homolog 4-like n=1 Tax=Oscarella lobularis TaxID=121494 RepID=UPI003313FB27